MTPQPIRPSEPVAWTVAALRVGQLTAAALFAVAIALHLLTPSDLAVVVATAAVIAVIATPALALVATIAEERGRDNTTVLLAGSVLAVLSVAVGIALLIGR